MYLSLSFSLCIYLSLSLSLSLSISFSPCAYYRSPLLHLPYSAIPMSFSPAHCRGKATAEPIMQNKAFAEPPLLRQLLPKATLQLASSLSNDDKEVLTYLVLYGHHVLLAMGVLSSAGKSPWKPWKSSSSKSSKRQQVFPSFSVSDSCTQSFVSIGLGGELSSKQSPLPHAKHKESFSCDCFSCYSTFWSRWNASPKRDLINEILDVIENSPQNTKGKKKKKADKRPVTLENETCSEKKTGRDENEQMHVSGDPGLNDEWPIPSQTLDDAFRLTDTDGKAVVAATSMIGDTSHDSIMADDTLTTLTQSVIMGCKKRLFRVVKQKEGAHVTSSRSPDSRCKVLGTEGIENEALSVSDVSGEGEKGCIAAAVAIDVPMNLTTESSETLDVGHSLALPQGKNAAKLHQHHRVGKRRSNQVTPLDCEGVLVVEEQEAIIVMEDTQALVSPRAADVGLGGRGFLARVFPDALGRVASRLWDLVSVRLRSRTVEYH